MDDAKYEKLRLSKQLCFPLYACARETIKLYTPYLEPLGLTYTQYITMMVLWEQKTVTAKELGRTLYLDSGTLTPLLKKLESKKLLTRRRLESDERNLVVTITPQGEELKEKALHIPDEMAKCVNLEKEETQTLYQYLYKMLECAESGR